MLDLMKPVQTRDGRKVEILSVGGDWEYPVCGLIEGHPIRYPTTWTLLGIYDAVFPNDERNLINVPEPAKMRPLNFDELFAMRDEWFKNRDYGSVERIVLFYPANESFRTARMSRNTSAEEFCRQYTKLDGSRLEVEDE